jgi:arsenate reductase
MAEGLWRRYGGAAWEVHSAGAEPAGFVHPLAIEAMAEINIDISRQRSKSLDEFVSQPFDLVVTVCDRAAARCPTFPGAKRVEHASFKDPAQAVGSEAEQLEVFRRVRDQIRDAVRGWIERQAD